MLSKILVAIALVVGVLWLMGMARRVGVARDTAARRDALSQQHRARKAQKGTEDLVRCPSCGAYHADGLSHRCEG
jgi:ribosomal protein L32